MLPVLKEQSRDLKKYSSNGFPTGHTGRLEFRKRKSIRHKVYFPYKRIKNKSFSCTAEYLGFVNRISRLPKSLLKVDLEFDSRLSCYLLGPTVSVSAHEGQIWPVSLSYLICSDGWVLPANSNECFS